MAPQISEKELDEIYTFAIQLGKDAGKMLMDAAKLRMASGGAAHESVEKENAVDIVTKTDTGKSHDIHKPLSTYNWLTWPLSDVEAFIHSSISKTYPSHK